MESIELPAWAKEIQTLLPVYPHFLLSGNVRDCYFGSGGSGESPRLMELPGVVDRALTDRGFRLNLTYEPTTGVDAINLRGLAGTDVERILGQPIQLGFGAGRLSELRELIVAVTNAPEPVGLVVLSASRLVRSVSDLSEAEFNFFREVERSSRAAARRATADGIRRVHSSVIWVADSDRALPEWFVVGNDALRSISVPMPHSGERSRMAANRLPSLATETAYDGPLDRPVRLLTEHTAGMGLSAIRNVIRIAQDQGLSPDRVDDAARCYRVGVVEDLWQADFIAERLRAELSDDRPVVAPDDDSPQRLEDRVLGQPDAVRKALDILARSASGLTAAHAGPSAARPRGVLFFAGPTGVGKTELAKAITKLLFDDERYYVRFDMSEFSAEHSADRLIGAPPGYVGHDSGGELTNALRERPFSVVLFDEVEKAHERILDKFLQVLDDGRLTDGRGQTVFFTEAVIVFTSNLGVYREVQDGSEGLGRHRRELAITTETHPTRRDRAQAIKQAIRDHFTLHLGRPELLNRIGDDNIVVFDFIDEDTALRILDGMLANVSLRLEREHGFPLDLTEESRTLLQRACLSEEVLAMGGRGIGAKLETALVNPVARLILTTPDVPKPNPTIRLSVSDEWWAAQWT